MQESAEFFLRSLDREPDVSGSDIAFNPRAFKLEDLRQGETEEERLANSIPIDEQLEQRLQSLHEHALQGDVSAHDELRDYARLQAQSYARIILATGHGRSDSRFFGFGLRRPPYTTSLHYNFVRMLDLRKIFAEELIKLLRIPHNIAVVAPADPACPQFSDPLASELADTHDRYSGETQKTCVMVRRTTVTPLSATPHS